MFNKYYDLVKEVFPKKDKNKLSTFKKDAIVILKEMSLHLYYFRNYNNKSQMSDIEKIAIYTTNKVL